MATIKCAGFFFYSNFDSGNLAKVECIPKHESAAIAVSRNGKDVLEIPDIEFNVWTKPDCVGTEFENGNRTWFYFGVKGYLQSVMMKINLVDLNRQAKMYSQGMAPVFKLVPGRSNWERIRDKPSYTVTDNIFTLSFKFKTPENIDTIMYFAFTYPYTYVELQDSLLTIDQKYLTLDKPGTPNFDDIYYVRECVCKSLEDRRIDLITISSYFNITSEKEERLKFLFPETHVDRPFKFTNKKIIFVSARVHPGETPSSFVFNGLLNFLLKKDDPLAIILRRLYVFKMIPFLNPDGVAKGHYRTDTRGINLNRMYLEPKLSEHPSVYAARKLIEYYHFGFDKEDVVEKFENEVKEGISNKIISETSFGNEESFTSENKINEQVQILSLEENTKETGIINKYIQKCLSCDRPITSEEGDSSLTENENSKIYCSKCSAEKRADSRLFLYMDMHGHASKKGIFMYGNHFDDVENNVECMLLPKIMSLNNHNFHFTACNFTERNMYLRDRRDGMSREGSGRVAVLKLTGLIRSYTLECNYNTGRMVNILPPMVKEGNNKIMHTLPLPPKYTPHIFEEVGAALGVSILDLTGNNPHSRIPNSEFHSLNGLREWLRVNCINELGTHRLSVRHKISHANNQNSIKAPRCKSMKNLAMKRRATTSKIIAKKTVTKTTPIPIEKKENIVYPSRDSNLTSQSVCYSASSSCSRILNRPPPKSKGLSIRKSAKRDNSLRSKSSPVAKLTSRSCQTSNTSLNTFKIDASDHTSNTIQTKESPKRIKVASESQVNDRLKLREICLIKENLTKKLIAKFSSSDSAQDGDDDDDLVVAWDPSYSPKVLSKFESRPTSPIKVDVPETLKKSQPSSSKQTNKPVFKNTPFASMKCKPSKSSLRRLTSASVDNPGKIDKMKKRKKLKAAKLV